MKTRRSLALSMGACISLLLTIGTVAPAAANTPSSAGGVGVGGTYFGNNNRDDCDGDYCESDFWRIPQGLRAQDRVSIAWTTTDASYSDIYLCLTGNVDDFSWSENLCNLTNDGAEEGDFNGRRDSFLVGTSAANAFVTFPDWGGGGPYQFTLESIQSKIGVALPAKTAIKRRGQIWVKPTYTNGQAIPDGTAFSLYMSFGFWDPDKIVKRSAVVSGGVARFNLNLKAKFKGKVAKMWVYRGADASFQATKSAKRKILIK